VFDIVICELYGEGYETKYIVLLDCIMSPVPMFNILLFFQQHWVCFNIPESVARKYLNYIRLWYPVFYSLNNLGIKNETILEISYREQFDKTATYELLGEYIV